MDRTCRDCANKTDDIVKVFILDIEKACVQLFITDRFALRFDKQVGRKFNTPFTFAKNPIIESSPVLRVEIMVFKLEKRDSLSKS